MSERQQLLNAIERAFNEVELGEGVSLHETVVIDNHGSTQERQAARLGDERCDWRRLIGDPEVGRIGYVGGPCFYDAAGLRFHLPAYLSLAVTDFERPDADRALDSLMFNLTKFSEYNLGRLKILNPTQRRCVRDVLVFLRRCYELESAELDEAIEGYWSSDGTPQSEAEQDAPADGPSMSS
jgi:hypothetical protein